MCRCTVGDVLDESGTSAHPCAFRCPLRSGMNCEEVVPVDPNARYSVSGPTRRERPTLTAGKSLECRDRPLVVDHVQNNRRPVHGSEGQRIVKVSFGGGALADPTDRNVVLPLDRRGHRPSGSLDRKSTRLNSSHPSISYAVFCLKKKKYRQRT